MLEKHLHSKSMLVGAAYYSKRHGKPEESHLQGLNNAQAGAL